MSWFALSLAAAVTQAAQFAVVKGRAREISPLVIVAWTQLVAFLGWLLFFGGTGHSLVWPGRAWLAIAASVVLVTGMSGLIARASARGDLSVVGPVYALSPVFTVAPDALLSGTLPTPLGFVGIGLAVAGTVGLSRGAASGGTLRALFRRRDALDALLAAIFLGMLAAVAGARWRSGRRATFCACTARRPSRTSSLPPSSPRARCARASARRTSSPSSAMACWASAGRRCRRRR